MPIVLTADEREKVGVLVNNLSVFAQQLIMQTGSDFATRALSNLATLKQQQKVLLKRLDDLARDHKEESPLRLVEDLRGFPTEDAAQILTIVRRCLSVCAFLGHLLAQPTLPHAANDADGDAKRLH